jgi:DNA-binding transcriptional regulator YhcF (GntR family)
VTPPPYHHILAARIGCRREQVTRELSTMTAEGMIEKTRGALVILKPQVLQTRLENALREDAKA